MPFDSCPATDVPSAEAIDTLRRVAALLKKRRRWTQRYMRRGPWWNRSYCTAGAVLRVVRKTNYDVDVIDEVSNRLNDAAWQRDYQSMISMNDHPEMTHSCLMHILDETLRTWESRHAVAAR